MTNVEPRAVKEDRTPKWTTLRLTDKAEAEGSGTVITTVDVAFPLLNPNAPIRIRLMGNGGATLYLSEAVYKALRMEMEHSEKRAEQRRAIVESRRANLGF